MNSSIVYDFKFLKMIHSFPSLFMINTLVHHPLIMIFVHIFKNIWQMFYLIQFGNFHG